PTLSPCWRSAGSTSRRCEPSCGGLPLSETGDRMRQSLRRSPRRFLLKIRLIQNDSDLGQGLIHATSPKIREAGARPNALDEPKVECISEYTLNGCLLGPLEGPNARRLLNCGYPEPTIVDAGELEGANAERRRREPRWAA